MVLAFIKFTSLPPSPTSPQLPTENSDKNMQITRGLFLARCCQLLHLPVEIKTVNAAQLEYISVLTICAPFRD